MLGIKSDIYSFGILLLQIITAKPPMGLIHHVERAIETGPFAEMLDPDVPDWPIKEAMKFTKFFDVRNRGKKTDQILDQSCYLSLKD